MDAWQSFKRKREMRKVRERISELCHKQEVPRTRAGQFRQTTTCGTSFSMAVKAHKIKPDGVSFKGAIVPSLYQPLAGSGCATPYTENAAEHSQYHHGFSHSNDQQFKPSWHASSGFAWTVSAWTACAVSQRTGCHPVAQPLKGVPVFPRSLLCCR